MGNTAFGYIRVSSDGQAGEDKNGLERQRRAIQAYAERTGATVVSFFADEGVSGTMPHAQRPGFKKLLAALYANGTHVVMVENCDRLGRDQEIIFTAVGELRRAGFTLLTADGQELTSSRSFDRFILGAQANNSEYVKALLRERMRAGKIQQRNTDPLWREGGIPYGFMSQGRHRPRLPNPEEQAIIARIKVLRATGQNLSQIVRQLNSEGLTPRNGRRWYETQVRRILQRTVRG